MLEGIYCVRALDRPVTFHLPCTIIVIVGCLTALVLSVRWLLGSAKRDQRRESIGRAPLKFLAPRGRGESVMSREEQQKLRQKRLLLLLRAHAVDQ